MRYHPAHGDIVEEISANHIGVSFNVLAERLRGRVSRARLLSEIRSLQHEDLVRAEPDPRHKQRKMFRLGQKLQSALDNLRPIEEKALEDPLGSMPVLISCYADAIRGAREEWLREFMKHRLQAFVSRSLESIEGGA